MSNDNNNIYKKISGFDKIKSIVKNTNLSKISNLFNDIIGTSKISDAMNYLSVPKIKLPRLYNQKLEESILEEREKINALLAEVHFHQEKSAYLYNRI